MIKERPSVGALVGILVFTLSCFLLLLFLWRTFGGTVPLTPEGYRVNTLYEEAVLVPVEADVRISGVNVGSVKQVERDGKLSRVTIQIDPQFAPLPADTKTVVRRKTLLGEAYVELTPGTPASRGGEALPEGSTLPLASSKPTVELDEFLRVFDERTRGNVQTVLKELAVATGTAGYDLNVAAGQARPHLQRCASARGDPERPARGLPRDHPRLRARAGSVLGRARSTAPAGRELKRDLRDHRCAAPGTDRGHPDLPHLPVRARPDADAGP